MLITTSLSNIHLFQNQIKIIVVPWIFVWVLLSGITELDKKAILHACYCIEYFGKQPEHLQLAIHELFSFWKRSNILFKVIHLSLHAHLSSC